MPPILPASLLTALVHAARASPAAEICGLLLGDGTTIRDALPARNVARAPASAFEIDPAALIAALRAERAGGATLLGHYHSHPGGGPRPSLRDAATAAPDGRLWLILGAAAGGLWRATAAGACLGRFDPVAWRRDDGEGLRDMPHIFSY